jgi:hypothetical protein
MRIRFPLLGLALAALLLRLLAYKLMATPFGGLSTAMCQYDCGWYMRIAQAGYGADAEFGNYGSLPHWAFFPLYPLLLRAALPIAPSVPFLVGTLLSNALFLGFVLIAARYLQRTRPGADTALWVVFIMVFPFGYIFSAIYSEVLFDLLLVASLLMFVERRILACATLIALLCATRPTGVLMLVPLGIDRIRHLWEGRARTDRVALLGETLLPLAIAPLGLSLFMAWQYRQTGDALAFNHVQILWNREWVGPWATLAHGIAQWDWELLLRPKDEPSQSYDAAWGLLGLGVAGWFAVRRRWIEAWVLAGTVVLPAATALHSLPRFVATNPFFLFALVEGVARLRRPAAIAGCFAGMGLLHGAVLVFWFIGANSTY